jgi:hypothetical protein
MGAQVKRILVLIVLAALGAMGSPAAASGTSRILYRILRADLIPLKQKYLGNLALGRLPRLPSRHPPLYR